MRKKVYFAGSIRGGRADAALYAETIAHIKEKADVLTEHIGDLSLNVRERGANADGAIYEQDTAWLRESDLLIGECTCPSLGVGYELAYAEARGIPCYIFYRPKDAALSAMLAGNPYFRVFPYEKKEDLFAAIDGILR